MESIATTYQELKDWLAHPFTSDIPVSKLILIFVLFCIVAYIAMDSVRILKGWMDNAAEAALEAAAG